MKCPDMCIFCSDEPIEGDPRAQHGMLVKGASISADEEGVRMLEQRGCNVE